MEQIEVLEKTGLNWSVRKEELTTKSGIIVPNKVALVRDDTNEILSVMGDGYQEYQNSELLELLYRINQSTGLDVCNGGDFGGGQKVWFQFKTNDLRLGDDKVEGYVTGCNSYDGSSSLAFGHSTFTISCLNSFFSANKQLDSKIRHSANLKPRVEKILCGIDQLLLEEKKTFETIKLLSETPMKENLKDMIIATVFDLPEVKDAKELSTRKKNQIELFELDWNKEINQKNSTLWGCLSSVTRFTTHSINKNQDRRRELKMFGRSGDIDRAVWKKVTAQLPMSAMTY